MTNRTRSSAKRKRAAEKRPASQPDDSEIEEVPPAPTKTKKKKTSREVPDQIPVVEDAGEDSDTATPAEPEPENHPSGHPFTDGEVEWKFVRLWLLKQTKKIIPGGYEHLSGEVNDLLKGLTHPQADRVRYSCMGEFTRLDNTATRTGTMLGYVLSHQVIPDPMIDPTALYFKIGKRVIRFSREEYALVSGLKFGPADFNPYTTHEIPPNSTFSRLFGENPNIRLVDLKNACTSKTFKVNGEAVKATTDDIVKLCKLLLCLGFALGVDGCKKKIPTWMWVLLESEEEWEKFPWGSYSYQVLVESIKRITSKPKKEGTLNITFKGNTVAFSAWIFEAIPGFGEIIGLKKDERQIPRFMQYSYTTSKGWPSDKQIKKSVVRMLKPHNDEKVQPFWKSLEADEAPNPFAFKYDPTDSMKKKGKVEDEGDEEEGEGGSGTGIITTAMIDAAAEAAVTKSQTAMKAMLEEYRQKSIEPMLAGWHKKLVDDVAEKVARYLLAKAGGENTYSCVGDITATLDTVYHLADTLNTVPSTPLEPATKHTTVHDTVGSSQTDDETDQRDEDWCVEGNTNTLSFPSYYIDENAVLCLDGSGCKIRSGSVEIGEDSDIDTSIACDSCDKWYHAFCVGFDPEGTCEGLWLCPGCAVEPVLKVSRTNYQNGMEIAGGDCLAEASFSGRVSVSVADDGETAVVISLVDGNQKYQESDAKYSEGMDTKVLSSSTSTTSNIEALSEYRNTLDPRQQETQVILSPAEQKICADDAVERVTTHVNNTTESGLGLDLDTKTNDLSEDQVPGSSEMNNRSEDLLPAVNMAANDIKVCVIPNVKQTTNGTAGAKRKHGNRRNAAGETESSVEAKLSRKKVKAERDGHPINLIDQQAASCVDDDSNKPSTQRSLEDSTYKCSPGKENSTLDIMDIVQETDRRSIKLHRQKSSSDIKDRETAAGLRLKKIMRRADDSKDSVVLVQELRKKIKEAVRNKSSEELGQNRFDPKLLDAFRAALAGSGAENRKPRLDMKAKRSLLQKGKVRESLTKKVYGTGGKRKHGWTRECEVEFWKHRCTKGSKPEKIQTLKSVLDLLRDEPAHPKKMPGNDQEAKGDILSRLYLADASVFPRKDDIKPVSALSTHEQKKESGSAERVFKMQPNNQSEINQQKNITLPEGMSSSLESKEAKTNPKGANTGAASSDAQPKIHPKGAVRKTAVGSVKIPLGKDVASKPEPIKGDRRKWALELLARKTAASGKNMQDKEEDTLILKGTYPLLGQLPKDMRPVLAPSRHNKVPASVRQVQLYRLTEHFLKKANLSKVCQCAETELAVADAINIEKDVANRSNSKLVYQNLCSQELLRRSEDIHSERAEETSTCSTSGAPEEASNDSSNLVVDEALKLAGLMSDSPPNSPSRPTEDVNDKIDSPENSIEGPDNVIEVDSHPDLDIYGDFEYSLEDDDFFGAGSLNTSKPESEPPKIKLLFSSLKPEKPDGVLDLKDHEMQKDLEPLAGPSELHESENKTGTGISVADDKIEDPVIQKPSDENDEEEPSLAECEELYGPDIEPLIGKFQETASLMPFEATVSNELSGENEGKMEESTQPSSDSEKKENADTKEKTSKRDTKQSETNSAVMKKVETYIKEHIRPLCKSGVITVEEYRWAVGKTTEKVMKYHSKEKNANFLIKEGEKVKKLAEQYVEASQQKSKG